MCGLGGYVTFSETPDTRLVTALAVIAVKMEDRGIQSWGWTDGRDIVKGIGRISYGLGDPKLYRTPVAMIHTRHATQGAITADNSHPYAIKGLIGMHNGMLDNHHELNQVHNRECVVDSQHIFHHIADGANLKDIAGYGTIVYTDVATQRHYIGHFNGGELAIAFKSDIGYLFASTGTALRAAMTLAGFNVDEWTDYGTKDGVLHEMTPDGLMIDGELPISAMWTGNTWNSVKTDTKLLGGKSSNKTADEWRQFEKDVRARFDNIRVSEDDDSEDELETPCEHCGTLCDGDDPMFELAEGDRYICETCTLEGGLDIHVDAIARITNADDLGLDCRLCGGAETDLFNVEEEDAPLCLGCLVEMYHSQELKATSRMYA